MSHAARLEGAFGLFPTRGLGDADSRLSAMQSSTTPQARSWREAEDEYLAALRMDDVIDNYVRPFHREPPSGLSGVDRGQHTLKTTLLSS
jgi:hypothetical protein